MSGSRKAVSTATGPADVVRTIRARHEAYTGGATANQKAWDRNRPVAKGAAAAAAGGAAVPVAAASVARNGAAKAGTVVTKGARVATVPASQVAANGSGRPSSLLVADKAGRVVDVGGHVPAEPAGLSPNDRLAWRREHLTYDTPTPSQPPPPRRAPNPKENGP